ncbi:MULTISPECIES: hypothetical protein [Blautia]|uniref:LPXTG cell wall anchor domain-containing protein n=1 Tax=Blautia obeum TaxID=40520 RepID=A0A414J4C9_9FIRM|nr:MULTISPECIES: hypothetical protein [Blautia]RHE39271.1 hypothetical protein DW740_11025 [Blautia obeum]
MQFFAVAALSAALVTSQFTYVPVMAESTAEVQASSLIPDNVTVEQPVPLSEISLPKSDYGTLSWVDSSSVPSKRVQSYDVVFRPYNTADLAKFSGWDGQSDAIYSSVTVVVSSFSKDIDYTDSSYENSDSQGTQENGNTGENGEDKTTETPGSTEISDNDEVRDQDTPDTVDEDTKADDALNKAQDTEETPENKDTSADTEKKDSADMAETPEATVAPDTPTVTEIPETTEIPEVTDTPDTTETPEITEAPESDKDNIFDGTEKNITPDERAQTVTDEEPSDEEKIELAATNHTCNGISVSGINLPWYVQFRAASGENYEFSNEAEANLFKAYEFELWDLKNNTEYEIPDGEYISVTVPVKAGYDYTIEHLLDSGAMEKIVPSVDGSTMVFSTHSFSPFGIAGSKTLVGEEIEDGSYSSGTTTKSSATVGPTSAAASSTATSTNSSTSGTSVQSSSDQSSQNATDTLTSDQGTQNGSSSVKAVSTGDNTPILPFVIIGIAAAVIVAVLVYLKKRK